MPDASMCSSHQLLPITHLGHVHSPPFRRGAPYHAVETAEQTVAYVNHLTDLSL